MDHDVENPGKTDVRKAATVHYPGETGKRGERAIPGFSTNVRPASFGIESCRTVKPKRMP